MNNSKKTPPIFLGVASVWFGAHCGPGVASGNQVASYFSRFSLIGIFLGFIAMAILGACIYYAIEYSRLTESYDFKSFTNKFFHPYEKLFSTFFEITYVSTAILVIGSCIATGAQALTQVFGTANLTGIIFISIVTILLTIFGVSLVRNSSTAMTFLILITLFITIIVALFSSQSQFADHWNQAATLPAALPKLNEISILGAIWSAILYAGFQSSGNMANVISVSEGLSSRRESIKAAGLGTIINATLILGVSLMLFAFPNVLGEFFNPNRVSKSYIPNLEITEAVGNPLLRNLYLAVLLLAVLSTLVGFSYSMIARYGGYIPLKDERKRDFVTVILLLIICAAVSLLGLDVIVSQGLKYVAYANVVLVIVPTLLIGNKRIREASIKEG